MYEFETGSFGDPMPGAGDPDPFRNVCGYCGCDVCVCTPESLTKWVAAQVIVDLARFDPKAAREWADALRLFSCDDEVQVTESSEYVDSESF